MRLHANSAEKKGKKTLWLGVRNHLFLCWYLSRRIQMSEELYISVQNARLLSSLWGEGWVGGWILSHLLALLAVYLHVLAIFPVSSAYKDSLSMSTLCMCSKRQTLISVPVLCRVFMSKLNKFMCFIWDGKGSFLSLLHKWLDKEQWAVCLTLSRPFLRGEELPFKSFTIALTAPSNTTAESSYSHTRSVFFYQHG